MKSIPVPTRELMTIRRLWPEPDGAEQRRDVTELQPDVAQAISPATRVGVDWLEPKLCPVTVNVVGPPLASPIATAGQLNGLRWEATGAAHHKCQQSPLKI